MELIKPKYHIGDTVYKIFKSTYQQKKYCSECCKYNGNTEDRTFYYDSILSFVISGIQVDFDAGTIYYNLAIQTEGEYEGLIWDSLAEVEVRECDIFDSQEQIRGECDKRNKARNVNIVQIADKDLIGKGDFMDDTINTKWLNTFFRIIQDKDTDKEVKLFFIIQLLNDEDISLYKAYELCTEGGLFSEHWIEIDAKALEYWQKYWKK
jgi:hypothetical protein